MFATILVPVDLEHVDKLEKSIRIAADLARAYQSRVCFVAITGKLPNRVARSPEQFEAELNMFAREQGERLDVETTGIVVFSNDVAVELDDKLLDAADRIGADLIVMASHIPGVADHLHLISSNAAYIVRHAKTSVFVVR